MFAFASNEAMRSASKPEPSRLGVALLLPGLGALDPCTDARRVGVAAALPVPLAAALPVPGLDAFRSEDVRSRMLIEGIASAGAPSGIVTPRDAASCLVTMPRTLPARFGPEGSVALLSCASLGSVQFAHLAEISKEDVSHRHSLLLLECMWNERVACFGSIKLLRGEHSERHAMRSPQASRTQQMASSML